MHSRPGFPLLPRNFGLVFGVAALLAACTDSGDQAQNAPPPTVTVASPLVQNLMEWDEFTGRLEATEMVEIRAGLTFDSSIVGRLGRPSMSCHSPAEKSSSPSVAALRLTKPRP